jgi:hypothetical protein
MADFRDVARELAPRGGWLRDPASQAWLGAMGGAVSASQALWRETVKARFASTAPEDALVLIGDTRQIERAPRETAAAYRLRLARCFEWHSERTTKDGYRNVLEALGVDPDDCHVWNDYEGGLGQWWSEVWIVADSTAGPWGMPNELDAGLTLDSGLVLDMSGITHDEIAWIRRQFRKVKWAGAYPVAIFAVLEGQALDMGLTLDSGLLLDVDTTVAVIPIGHVWDQETLLWGTPPAVLDAGKTLDDPFTWSDEDG